MLANRAWGNIANASQRATAPEPDRRDPFISDTNSPIPGTEPH